MTRYLAIRMPPRAWSSATDVMEQRPTCTVHEEETSPVYTGLVDQNGVGIYRKIERAPLGFLPRAKGNAAS